IGEVLLAISSNIARTLEIERPQTEDLLKFPEITFKNFLQDALASLPHQGLIIALDEFEVLEELIKDNKITDTFLRVFRTWTQLSPRLGFIFAGLHTLEEMTADYFHPFFGSVYPIPVSFLSPESTRVILANPVGEDEDFPLDYTPSALDKIYQLTHGQPYLVQLIGFRLVRF
ncbi:MAG: ATP-binding protein, partial [Microcystis sp.]